MKTRFIAWRTGVLIYVVMVLALRFYHSLHNKYNFV